MQRLIAMTTLAAMLVFSGLVDAAGQSGASGKSPPIEGNITVVGSKGFRIAVPRPPLPKAKGDQTPSDPGERIVTILCDGYTKFQTGGERADASIVKTGVHVAITGSQYGVDSVLATVVNVVGEKGKKK